LVLGKGESSGKGGVVYHKGELKRQKIGGTKAKGCGLRHKKNRVVGGRPANSRRRSVGKFRKMRLLAFGGQK